MDISALLSFYRGFSIDSPVGNNAFSYVERTHKKLDVAPLIHGSPEDVRQGNGTAFSDFIDDAGPCDNPALREVCSTGLEHFVHIHRPDQDLFIIDNHNHAFSCWAAGLFDGVILRGSALVHVDQHKDMRQPFCCFSGGSVLDACRYANEVLNVGNFIPPALELGWFSGVMHVGDVDAFGQKPKVPFVLDIDMDIFAPLMDHIPEDLKISRLRAWIDRAAFVTIATSPFFMDQAKAVELVRILLKTEPY